MSENINDLNEQVEVLVDDATVITVPIDATLSNSNEAADAKAVGDALALKADAASVVAIKVNGESADNQGNIILDGSEINVSGTDQRSIAEALAASGGRTGEDIPLTAAEGSPTIAAAVQEAATMLEENVVTISAQSLDSNEQEQVRTNIGAISEADLQHAGVVYETITHEAGGTTDITAYLYKFGRVVFMTIPRQATAASISSGSAFLYLPEGFTPATENPIHMVGTAGGYSNFITFYVSPTAGGFGGIASRTNIAAETYITLSGCWIADD